MLHSRAQPCLVLLNILPTSVVFQTVRRFFLFHHSAVFIGGVIVLEINVFILKIYMMKTLIRVRTSDLEDEFRRSGMVFKP